MRNICRNQIIAVVGSNPTFLVSSHFSPQFNAMEVAYATPIYAVKSIYGYLYGDARRPRLRIADERSHTEDGSSSVPVKITYNAAMPSQ